MQDILQLCGLCWTLGFISKFRKYWKKYTYLLTQERGFKFY